jgi:nuclear transport factor 2 (NTF2) superfamily protein
MGTSTRVLLNKGSVAPQCGATRKNRSAIGFAYEWHNKYGQWYRSYDDENCQFDEQGLMAYRYASINNLVIDESQRKFHWPLGPRP